MTTTHTLRYDAAALADGAFLAGLDDRTGTVHAVARQVAVDATEGGGNRVVLATAVCHRSCRLAFTIGSFVPGNEWLNRHGDRCPDCAWILALHTGQIEAQIAALTPEGRDRELTQRLLDEPLAVVNIAQAMLAAARYRGPDNVRDDDVRPSALSAQLGHLTRHAPEILIPEECAERSCAHPTAPGAVGDWADCTFPIIDIACPECSLIAVDTYAGEWAGTFHDECTVAAPCSVLQALGAYFDVAVGGRRNLTGQAENPVPATTPTADTDGSHPRPGRV
jgi:hypothetical protein